MDPIVYLTSSTTQFTALAWVVFIAQIVLIGVGSYFSFVHQDINSVRRTALQRLGYALLVLGVFGTLFGVLWLAMVPPFTLPIWLYGLLLIEVLFALYTAYYSRTTYVQQLAAANTSKPALRRVQPPQARATAQSTTSNGVTPVAVSVPREVGITSGRRGARRDRKRRKR